jgi:hypothetical protein
LPWEMGLVVHPSRKHLVDLSQDMTTGREDRWCAQRSHAAGEKALDSEIEALCSNLRSALGCVSKAL